MSHTSCLLKLGTKVSDNDLEYSDPHPLPCNESVILDKEPLSGTVHSLENVMSTPGAVGDAPASDISEAISQSSTMLDMQDLPSSSENSMFARSSTNYSYSDESSNDNLQNNAQIENKTSEVVNDPVQKESQGVEKSEETLPEKPKEPLVHESNEEVTSLPNFFCAFPPPPPSVEFITITPLKMLEKLKAMDNHDKENAASAPSQSSIVNEEKPNSASSRTAGNVGMTISTQTIKFNGPDTYESDYVSSDNQSAAVSTISENQQPKSYPQSLETISESEPNLTVPVNSQIISEEQKAPAAQMENVEQPKEIPQESKVEPSFVSEEIVQKSITQALTNVFNDEAKKVGSLANKIIENLKEASGNKEQLAEMLQKNEELKLFVGKLLQLLEEKTNLSFNLEKQNMALSHQSKSLKDVINITKDLLNIRNMEVEQLHSDLASMESMIKDERMRHNLSVERLQEAMKLNDQLKKEYLLQLDLFQKLKIKFTEKILDLSDSNRQFAEFIKGQDLKFVPKDRVKLVEGIVSESVKK